MKQLFLHAGLPKTGTTSIQNFLFEQRAALEAAGFLFPAPPPDAGRLRAQSGAGWGKHASLLAAIQGRWDELGPGEWERWLAEFRRAREDPALHTLILSHETFGNRAGALKFDLLQPLIEGFAVHILLVVREAEAWLTSLYEQRVTGRQREGGSADRLNTVKSYIEFGFQGRIAALQAAFPGAKVTIAPFEEVVLGDGLVPNIADMLGLPAAARAQAVAAKRANTSMSQDAIEVLRRCNAAGFSQEEFLVIRRAVTAGQRRSPGTKPKRGRVMRRRRARDIADRYEADRAWIAAQFGTALAPAQDCKAPVIAFADDRLEAVVAAAEPFLDIDQTARLRSAVRTETVPRKPERRRG